MTTRMGAAALLLVLLASATASADDVYLKDGGMLSGEVIAGGDQYTVVDRDRKYVIEGEKVARVVKKACLMDEYRDRLSRVSKTDAVELYEFARWLDEHEWPSRAQVVYEQVIRIDPDHREARRALGYKLYEGEWLSASEIRRRDGLVEFEGHWYTPHDLAALKKEIESNEQYRQALAQQRLITEQVGKIVRKFATFEKRQRAAAYDELLKYAEEVNSPLLRKFADDTLAYYEGLAAALCRKMKTRAEVNLTETELVRPIPAIETSLGGFKRIIPLLYGRTLILVPEQVPVSIQLPQMDVYETHSTADIPSGCD
ncbi:MAG TPA: hypothetical protein VFY93_19260 [Planctomycetota bacterium]|nr:hypothetical protein [Planctomycetota bacterium]